MRSANLLINGTEQPATGGKTFDRVHPLSAEMGTRTAAASIADVDRAIDAAAAAFPLWSAQPPAARRRLLLLAAEKLHASAADFVEAGVAETGGTPGWLHFNVALAADILIEAAAMTTQITGETIPSNVPGCFAMSIRKPCGVVVGMAPWNAQVILAARAVAMPLACGNTVVLKASEQCPGVHALLGRVLQASGLGDGVVNVIHHAPEDAPQIVERLIADPRVRRVNFTGSTRVGRIVGELCGRHLKPCLLELGGKAPFLVLEDANVDAAVDAAVFGAFMNQGQICMSTERIIVDEAVADSFVSRFTLRAQALETGNPSSTLSPLGAVSGAGTAGHLRFLLEDAEAKGATIVAGSRAGEIGSTLLPATVVDRVTPAMKLFREESFGPIVAITRVAGDDAAIAAANDTEYGLSAAVFSQNMDRAISVAGQLDTGICHINGPTVHDEPQMPFGGVKSSGFGRFGGRAAISEFTDLQWITVQTTPRHYPI